MGVLQLSRGAENDLLEISFYTLYSWGEVQAEKYIRDLRECARMLADSPLLGRSCDRIRVGLHRFEKGRHVIYYRRNPSGILVVRILHQSMLPERQSFEAEDAD